MPKINVFVLFLIISSFACAKDDEMNDDSDENTELSSLYFPPIDSDSWDELSLDQLNWDESKIDELLEIVENNGSRAFIVLYKGRIVIEAYYGRTLNNQADFDRNRVWYWASAGKTITALAAGIAQDEGLLDIQNPTSAYLGTSWTSLSAEQEAKITPFHQLTMTTGLDDEVANQNDTDAASLQFKADPATRWSYHNAPYTLLTNVVESASGEKFDDFVKSRICDKIGMTGFFQDLEDTRVYFSNARSMARFGILIQAKGNWENEYIIRNAQFVENMISQSQAINPSYGYLWWLNNNEGFILPQSQQLFSGKAIPSAPEDMYSGIGLNGQFISIIPSKELIIIRMGENANNDLVPFLTMNEVFEKLFVAIPAE